MEENKIKKVLDSTWFWIIVAVFVFIIAGTYIGLTGSLEDISETNNNVVTNETKSNIIVEETEKVSIIDFNTIDVLDVYKWFEDNGIKGNVKNEYSDTVEENKLISQSIPANTEVNKGTELQLIYSLGKEPTLGQKEALESARSYINSGSFSRKGLIEQLLFEGFTQEEAEYAVNKIGY